MKRLYTLLYIIIGMVLCATMPSCENKHETSGDLGGMWQLTQWRDGDSVCADQHAAIYYTISRQLLKVQCTDVESYICQHEQRNDSLILSPFTKYTNSTDSIVQFSSLAHIGIPIDGKFHIDILNHSHLQLSSGRNILQFRKY